MLESVLGFLGVLGALYLLFLLGRVSRKVTKQSGGGCTHL